jgi:N6-L-threonylcarbamoyladenine synthase
MGDRKKYNLPIPNLGKGSFDLSFSGIKSAVRRLVEKEREKIETGLGTSALDLRPVSFSDTFINDVCASFEETCGRVFIKKLKLILEAHPAVKDFYFVGGVSANTYLKSIFEDFVQGYGIKVLTPEKIAYSTDNAAMIGSAAYFQIQNKNALQPMVQHVISKSRLSL